MTRTLGSQTEFVILVVNKEQLAASFSHLAAKKKKILFILSIFHFLIANNRIRPSIEQKRRRTGKRETAFQTEGEKNASERRDHGGGGGVATV